MYKKMLLGGLLKAAPSIRAAVKSKPFKKAAKDAMEKTKALYKKAKKSDPERKSFKDEKFMKGLEKLDIQRAKGSVLLNMSQFVLGRARKAGNKPIVREMRRLRGAMAGYGKSLNKKAKAMMQRKLSKKKVN